MQIIKKYPANNWDNLIVGAMEARRIGKLIGMFELVKILAILTSEN